MVYITICVLYYKLTLFYNRRHWKCSGRDDNNRVILARPSIVQSEVVISKAKEQQMGNEWNIHLSSSSPERIAVIINNLNKCTMRRLDIVNTSLDSRCVSLLSEVLKTSKNTSAGVLFTCWWY